MLTLYTPFGRHKNKGKNEGYEKTWERKELSTDDDFSFKQQKNNE